MDHETLQTYIVKREIEALERWNNGDPYGYLEISAPDVVYFDPFLETRLNGREALKVLYDSLKGKVKVDKYEMIDPKVQITGNAAVLTFNLHSYSGNNLYKWHCTEVYFFIDGNWLLIQTHWSFSK